MNSNPSSLHNQSRQSETSDIATGEKSGKTFFRETAVALAISFLLLAAALGFLAHRNTQTEFFPMHVRVTGGVVGFNVTTALEFGSVPAEGGSRKTITVENTFDSQKTISFRVYGEMAPWVSVSGNSFKLAPHDKTNVSVYAIIPPGTKAGDYYGTLEMAHD